MTEPYTDLGGQKTQPITDEMPVLRHRPGHFKKPLCGECVDGWLLDPESLKPDRRCPCRLSPEEDK